MNHSIRSLIALVSCAVVLFLAGCSGSGSADDSTVAATNKDTLRIIAGSEVKDMLPILLDAEKEIGVKTIVDYVGTLDGAEQLASGAMDGKFDATWFPSNKYLSLLNGATDKVKSETKIMTSPVALGLKLDAAARLGWDSAAPTWAEVADAATSGELTYGMSNPASSNSGFSTLVSVATAEADTGNALSDADVAKVTPALTDFFKGQRLTSGSSGWLAEKFQDDESVADGIFNYESVIKTMPNMTAVVPSDGTVISDYPLTFLKSAPADKEDAYKKLVAWLLEPDQQNRIASETHRRTVTAGSSEQNGAVVFDLPFPNRLQTVQSLISSYVTTIRKPGRTYFVLDNSGSMSGDRLNSLKSALGNLTGNDTSTTGRFTAFQPRETITLRPFNHELLPPTTVTVNPKNTSASMEQLQRTTDQMRASGGTAIYGALIDAYREAESSYDEDTFTSIVLMSDGQNTDGPSAEEFLSVVNTAQITIPVFTVMFGNASPDELEQIAERTDGRVFDAREGNLSAVFKEIRGYQ
jgi:Ca-activated chloride channel family protein